MKFKDQQCEGNAEDAIAEGLKSFSSFVHIYLSAPTLPGTEMRPIGTRRIPLMRVLFLILIVILILISSSLRLRLRLRLGLGAEKHHPKSKMHPICPASQLYTRQQAHLAIQGASDLSEILLWQLIHSSRFAMVA